MFQRYGLTYISGPLPKQVGSAWAKVFRLVAAEPQAGGRRVAGGGGGAAEGGHGAGAGEALAAGHVRALVFVGHGRHPVVGCRPFSCAIQPRNLSYRSFGMSASLFISC